MKFLAEKLKAHNLKVTPQRLAIFNVLYNTDKHPSAETIYRALEVSHPSMSLATVYKTLDTLNKAGLIQEINVGEDSFRYDANKEDHTHIICLDCHEVYDLPNLKSVSVLKEELLALTDFTVEHEQLFFYGKCKSCQLNSDAVGSNV